MDIPKFYTEATFTHIYKSLKNISCPHCKKRGFLILHGYIRGYVDSSGFYRVIKGHRIFCSNRDKRQGCGHTWSIYLSNNIPGFSLSADTLSDILTSEDNIFKGWKASETEISISSFYRILKRFVLYSTIVRTCLVSRFKPPSIICNPLLTTMKHLNSLHINLKTALSLFQLTFQVPILA